MALSLLVILLLLIVYGKDLIEEVQDETSGDFRSVLIALLQVRIRDKHGAHHLYFTTGSKSAFQQVYEGKREGEGSAYR